MCKQTQSPCCSPAILRPFDTFRTRDFYVASRECFTRVSGIETDLRAVITGEKTEQTREFRNHLQAYIAGYLRSENTHDTTSVEGNGTLSEVRTIFVL